MRIRCVLNTLLCVLKWQKLCAPAAPPVIKYEHSTQKETRLPIYFTCLKEFFAMIYTENCTSNSLLQLSLLLSCQSSSSTARGYRFTSQRKKLHPLLAFLSAEFVSWPNLPWLNEHVKKALPWLGPGLTTDLRRVRRPHWHSGGVTPPLLKQTMGGVTEEFTFVVIEGGVERLGFFL